MAVIIEQKKGTYTGDKGPFTQWVHVDYIRVTGIK
jgi:hypothetical protein